MILTVCPNPCIDNALYIENFNTGKLNRVKKKVVSLGGKAMNVAVAAKRLGYDSYSTGFMFEDGSKKFFEKLSYENVPFIFAMCDGPVRVNTKILSEPFMQLTEINENGTPVSFDKQFELIESVRTLSRNAEITVFSGSLPLNVADDYYYRAGLAVDANCKIVVDTEGEKLKNALKLKPALIKPNLYELRQATGKKTDSMKDILSACDELLKMGAKCILVSMGGGGAVIYDGKEACYAKAPQVEIKNTVGAGDSMLAAACIALNAGYCMEGIIKSAVAGGTAAVLCEGTGLLSKENYDKIFPLVETERIR